MGIVTFVPADFKSFFPEFSGTSDARLNSMATITTSTLVDNAGGIAMDDEFRLQLIYLAVAHLLLIYGIAPTARPDGSVDNAPPGRISSATEGSISTSFQLEVTSANGSAAFWNQTKYGVLFWAATARFRSFRYFPSGVSGIGQAVAF